MSNESEYLKEIAQNTLEIAADDNSIDLTATNNSIALVRDRLPADLSTSGNLKVAIAETNVLPVSGSVAVSNLPPLQNVVGSVSVSNLPSTQPISAAALPLPTGAALNSTLVEVRDRLSAAVPYSTYLNLGNSVGTVVKNTSGKLFGFSIHNKSNATIWINFFNKAFSPTSGDVAVEVHPVFAGGYLLIDAAYFGSAGVDFSAGIALIINSTAGNYLPNNALLNNVAWSVKYL